MFLFLLSKTKKNNFYLIVYFNINILSLNKLNEYIEYRFSKRF